uniref:Nucleotide-diphospho-sugar transferase domain-containing protein n=1 Tax=viral metagenome TaxID=1070528 RepID=A0A6C0DRA4_9ZZZZ
MLRDYDPNRYIIILTDNVSFFDEYLDGYKLMVSHFDYNNHIHENIDTSNDWNKYGLIPKLYHSYYTPFETTMYLDVDMWFKKDFIFIWEEYYKSPDLVLYAGVSDENNKSPSSWHWGTIDEVIEKVGVNIPQISGTLIVYNKNRLKEMVNLHVENILNNISKWNIKTWYRNGLPEEIIYAIIFGYEKIKPSIELNDWIFNNKNCDPMDKNV